MARNFDGIDDRITASTVSVSGDWTMGAWFNADTAGESNFGALIWVEPSPSGTVVSTVRFDNSTGRIHAHQGHNLTHATAKTDAFIGFGTWFLLFCTFTASDKKLRLYKGTVAGAVAEVAYVSQGAGNGLQTTGGGVITAGNRVGTDFTFDGSITRPLYASRLWTLTEMEAFRANGTLPTSDGTLLGYWKFDEATGTTANDSSGNARHGTITGAIFADDPFGSTASATSTLPAFTSSATTTAASTASAASTLPSPTTTASTTSSSTASITSLLPSPTTTAAATSADNSISATATSTLPAFTSQSTTSLTSTSTISTTLPTLSTLAAAALASTSTISSTLPPFNTSISASSGSQAPQVIQISPLLLALEGELAYTTSQIAIGV